jgi:predicted DNA-binding transcriptional regulator YafY
MPVNRNALLRYKAIDSCLRNRRRKWTLDDLIECVSNTLYEYEGIDKGISRRSIQADIQVMRSSKLGYNAPIVVVDKKYYAYDDPDYSITNIPLTEQDLLKMNEAVEVLRQFKGFSHFSQLNEVVQKLEDHVHAAATNTRSVIVLEKNDQLRGLQYLDPLYQAIIQQQVLQITYQSFRAREAQTMTFHPWWLKEFKNRWFAVGVTKDNNQIFHLALDRIQAIEVREQERYIPNEKHDPEEYYQHVIGVTVSERIRPVNVRILVSHEHAPYVETKPLHHSQQVVERTEAGVVIALKVQLNYEMEREILGFGPGMVVLAPERLKKIMHNKFRHGAAQYEHTCEEDKNDLIIEPDAVNSNATQTIQSNAVALNE